MDQAASVGGMDRYLTQFWSSGHIGFQNPEEAVEKIQKIFATTLRNNCQPSKFILYFISCDLFFLQVPPYCFKLTSLIFQEIFAVYFTVNINEKN